MFAYTIVTHCRVHKNVLPHILLSHSMKSLVRIGYIRHDHPAFFGCVIQVDTGAVLKNPNSFSLKNLQSKTYHNDRLLGADEIVPLQDGDVFSLGARSPDVEAEFGEHAISFRYECACTCALQKARALLVLSRVCSAACMDLDPDVVD